MSNFLNKIPVSPIISFGNPSVPNGSTIGTNFSILQTGGYMEVYSLSGLTYTIPPTTTGIIEFSGNSIPIQFTKGSGSVFSPDVLTLNSDNISSGRRKLGMLAYVYETNKIYQFKIDNYDTLWSNATGATGPGGPTVVISDFGTTIKNNSAAGIAFINAWTSSTISGVNGFDDTNASWRVLQTGGSFSGGGTTITGGTFDNITDTLTLNNSTGGTITITGFTDYYTTGFTFNPSTYDLTIQRNDGLPNLSVNLSILSSDVTITGGTYNSSNGTATFTNNTGGTFTVTGFLTGFTDIYVTGGTFNNSNQTLTLTRTDNINVNISGFTDVFVTGVTKSNSVATFTNNTGGTFNLTGLTDTFVTGATKSGSVVTFTNNTGGTFTLTGLTDVFVTGGTYTNGTTIFTNNTGGTFNVTGFFTGTTDVFVTGGTYSNGTAIFTNNTGGTFNVTGFPTATGGTTNYYGSFSDTTNQPVSGSNTATLWKYNTTEISNGIFIEDNTKIKVSNDGIYEIGYSAQIEKTQGGSAADVTIWVEINGVKLDRSSSTTTLVANSSYQLPFVSYILNLNANDYVEFYFSSPSEYVQLTTLSGLTSPTRPISPSVIIVAKAVGNAVLNNSGDTYVTGFTLNGSNLDLTQNRLGTYSGFSVNLPFLPLTGGTLTGSLTAPTYFGDGSNLTGISRGGGGGGQLYYFNISQTQSPYYEFSTTATTSPEQIISATTAGNTTVLVGGFMTPSTLPNITNLPAGILSFYLHTYGETTNHSFNIYCELYKRTTGGTETLLFTSDSAAVVGNTTTMVISDGYFSGSSLNSSDRLVVKVYGENVSNQTRTIYLVSEGSQHYSFAFTTIPTSTDTYVTGATKSGSVATFTNNFGGTFTLTGLTDTFVTGGTYSDGTVTFTNNTGGTFSVIGFFTGTTDVFVTGGTKSGTVATFTNNTGGTFNLTGLTDTFVTGGTYTGTTIVFTNNTGGTFSVTGITSGGGTFTGGTVTGATNFTGGLTANTFSSTTISATTYNGYVPLPTEASSTTGVTLSFITDSVYGTLSSPETGTTITANTTNALLGVTNIIIHSGSTSPTFSSQYKKLTGSGNYSSNTINYIFTTYITSTEIIYAINQRT